MSIDMEKAVSSTRPEPSYTFQRVHAALQTGHALTVRQKREEPVQFFMQQSTLDGACGTHMLAMLLVIFGLAKASALHDMSRRKYGVAADVWRVFSPYYFNGINPEDWVEAVDSLGLPLELTARFCIEHDVDTPAVQWLMQGDLVAIAFASVKHRRTKHWALAVGVEGVVTGQRHYPQRILLLDSGASEPVFQAFNARLRLAENGPGSRRTKPGWHKDSEQRVLYWLHESEAWHPESVRLLAAIRVRLKR
jgi:hypothetical protein